jgi:hypothetical protein
MLIPFVVCGEEREIEDAKGRRPLKKNSDESLRAEDAGGFRDTIFVIAMAGAVLL